MSSILAHRYVYPLFQIASERGIVEEVLGELVGIRELIVSSPDLKRLLFNPAEARTTRLAAMRVIIREWEQRQKPLSDLTKRFLELILRKNRLEVLQEMVPIFKTLRNWSIGQEEGVLEVATPLDQDTLEFIRGRLERLIGKRVSLELVERPELVGGWRVRIGSRMMDGSIVHQLKRLRETIARGTT